MTFISRDQLGLPGQLGMVLSVFCLYFYLFTLLPAEDKLAQLEAAQVRLLDAAARSSDRLARVPPSTGVPDVLKRLNALAENSGLVVDRVAYEFKDGIDTRRLVVTVPAEGNYPAIRLFIRDALALTPTASLDSLSLQRTQAIDPVVSAQVGLSYLFKVSP